MKKKGYKFVDMRVLVLFFLMVFSVQAGTKEDIQRKLSEGKSVRRIGTNPSQGYTETATGIVERKNGIYYVPYLYKPKKAMPAILLLKWYTGSPHAIVDLWKDTAEARSYILIAPKSTKEGYTNKDKKKIIRFLRKALSEYNVDQTNIMVFGHSNGAHMAIYIGTEYQKYFKGIALSGGAWSRSVRSYGYVPATKIASKQPRVYIVHGKLDSKVPPALGRGTRDQFKKRGYNVIYEELGGVGHVIPDHKKEPMLDWLESFSFRE